MGTNSGYAHQRYEQQERPLRKATANRRDFSAVANRSVDLVLIKDLHIALGVCAAKSVPATSDEFEFSVVANAFAASTTLPSVAVVVEIFDDSELLF
jgi:hypothetical protein